MGLGGEVQGAGWTQAFKLANAHSQSNERGYSFTQSETITCRQKALIHTNPGKLYSYMHVHTDTSKHKKSNGVMCSIQTYSVTQSTEDTPIDSLTEVAAMRRTSETQTVLGKYVIYSKSLLCLCWTLLMLNLRRVLNILTINHHCASTSLHVPHKQSRNRKATQHRISCICQQNSFFYK